MQNRDEYEEALVAVRRRIYEDEGVDMREQMMDKIRQWFVAFREQVWPAAFGQRLTRFLTSV
jgi:hypothetical protein